MASSLNSEFNYRYQVIGDTIWEKIKTLKGFLEGRVRAAALEEVGALKLQAKISKLAHLRTTDSPEHEQLELQAEILELQSHQPTIVEAFDLNRGEITMLERLLAEAYVIAEPTRIPGYTDHQMFEANAANEFTVMIGRQIQSEIIATGRPLPATIRNAMSNPHTFEALKLSGLIPIDTLTYGGNHDPLHIEFKPV